jgi:hypothetical protein
VHCVLPLEAGANTCGEVGVGNVCHVSSLQGGGGGAVPALEFMTRHRTTEFFGFSHRPLPSAHDALP